MQWGAPNAKQKVKNSEIHLSSYLKALTIKKRRMTMKTLNFNCFVLVTMTLFWMREISMTRRVREAYAEDPGTTRALPICTSRTATRFSVNTAIKSWGSELLRGCCRKKNRCFIDIGILNSLLSLSFKHSLHKSLNFFPVLHAQLCAERAVCGSAVSCYPSERGFRNE